MYVEGDVGEFVVVTPEGETISVGTLVGADVADGETFDLVAMTVDENEARVTVEADVVVYAGVDF